MSVENYVLAPNAKKSWSWSKSGAQMFGASNMCEAQGILKNIMQDDSRIENLCTTHRTSSENFCPHFGLSPAIFEWASHFTSVYGFGAEEGEVPFCSL